MKRIVLILIGLCFLGFLTWEVQAVNPKTAPKYTIENNMPNEYDRIELHGLLATIAGPNAIVAGASDDAVYIEFNQSFGNVNISIYNDMGGTVYSTVVNTDVQQVVIIPFNAAASGTYTVELNNVNGYADGNFDHD